METNYSNEKVQIKAQENDGAIKIEVGGRIDSVTAPELLKAFESVSAGKETASVRIDMTELKYISSAGLRVLVVIGKKYKDLKITGVSDMIKEVFAITGFDRILDLE